VEARTLESIAAACSGELIAGSPHKSVLRVCTDSRQVQAGDLFFALKGERFDGHDFLPEVIKKADAVVVERGRATKVQGPCAVVAVENTRVALGRLAGKYRQDFTLPIVVVAGSNGKTTTKELVAAVLRQKHKVLWSEASFNNDIGVPLTLLKLERKHQAAVLETGTNHPGELEPLVKMICPDYGVITSIGREHLEFFGDLAAVAAEEGMLGELLSPRGTLLVNGDDPWAGGLIKRTHAAVVRVGINEGNQWRASDVRLDAQGITFAVEAPKPGFSGIFRVPLLGRHQAVNASFAIALGAELGLDRAQIQSGLQECRTAKMRLELWELNGIRVLDDAYNANADSMAVALQTLHDLPCKGRRMAVLGDMAELGAHSEAAHEEVGRRAAELGVEQLFVVGKMAAVMARGARNAGLNRVLEFADVETAANAVKQLIKSGDVVLLKASRATRLERVADVLRGGSVKRN
jgi:UDP-N-acetylmuramoyl-tripeptide--D-alanyl-D-alanine ligase